MKRLKAPKYLHIENRTVRYTLCVLFGLIVADGLISQFLVTGGYGSEINPFLTFWVERGSFLPIKIAGGFLATSLLWIKYNANPKLVYRIAVVAVAFYTVIVCWNSFAFLLAP